VATSLTAGEAVRKQVGILDIKGNQFRLKPIPLTQVRAFMMGEVSLNGRPELDPEDSKVDVKINRLLEDEVKHLIFEARSKRDELIEDCQKLGNRINKVEKAVKYTLQKPSQVLVRLKVEHSGFTTLNNQRFGAKFVGEVANPVRDFVRIVESVGHTSQPLSSLFFFYFQVDLLLFHRKRDTADSKGKSRKKKPGTMDPIAPEELEEMNVEDLVKENLDQAEKKLEILSEEKLSLSLDDYVSKEVKQALTDGVAAMLERQQKELIKRRNENGEGVSTGAQIREIVQEEAERRDQTSAKQKRNNTPEDHEDYEEGDDDDELESIVETSKKRPAKASHARKLTVKNRQRVEDMSDDVEVAPRARGRRQTNRSVSYAQDDSNGEDESEASISIQPHNEDELDEIEEEKPKKKAKAVTKPKQANLSFESITSKKSNNVRVATSRSKARKKRSSLDEDSEEDKFGGSYGVDDDWGTANTNTEK
jgi:double-strand break repair protein MRE11